MPHLTGAPAAIVLYGLAGDAENAGAVARGSLPEDAVRNNLAYYAKLRSMDDRARIAAMLSGRNGASTGPAIDGLETSTPLAARDGVRKFAGPLPAR